MADRQDIDALLIGALYGELNADESERLEAHLSSHPQDRMTLDALTQTRVKVREGLAAVPQAEPPPAVTALLLQEAARRAASRRSAGGAGSGLWAWLQGFLRPMFAHPALASAAALVLVAGTASALYLRNRGLHEPVATVELPASESAVATSPPAGAAPATATQTYPAQLDDDLSAKGQKAFPLEEAASPEQVAKHEQRSGEVAKPDSYRRERTNAPAKPMRTAGKDANVPSYIDVTTPEPKLKSLDEPPASAAVSDNAGRADRQGPVSNEPVPSPDITVRAPLPDPPLPANRDEEWAKTQHQRVIAAVRSKDCNEAGRLGSALAQRAPEYYDANVANDRTIRPCRAYIDRARRKESERRAKTRAPSEADLLEPAQH